MQFLTSAEQPPPPPPAARMCAAVQNGEFRRSLSTHPSHRPESSPAAPSRTHRWGRDVGGVQHSALTIPPRVQGPPKKSPAITAADLLYMLPNHSISQTPRRQQRGGEAGAPGKLFTLSPRPTLREGQLLSHTK